MKPTDEQIVKAATEAAKVYGPDENTHRHAFQLGYETAIKQMKPILTSERLPTKEDADNFGEVFVFSYDEGWWIENWNEVHTDYHTHWIHTLPKPEEE